MQSYSMLELGRAMTPILVAFMLGEALALVTLVRRRYAAREALASLTIAVLQRVARYAQFPLLALGAGFVWQHRIVTVAGDERLQAVLAFVAVEFAYYWMHRSSHHVRLLWATHAVHHSAEQLNSTAALRLGIAGALTGESLFFLPLIWLGFAPAAVFGALSVNLLYQFFLHTELVPSLGPLEWIFNTPAQHRVHHASNERYLDRNFGGVLCVFDRLFGTFAALIPGDTLRYGLSGKSLGTNPLWILVAEWCALGSDVVHASGPRKALGLVFGSPRA